jgi:hypothetical protein
MEHVMKYLSDHPVWSFFYLAVMAASFNKVITLLLERKSVPKITYHYHYYHDHKQNQPKTESIRDE